jgi:DNA-binding NarL/FixJ family response regulator
MSSTLRVLVADSAPTRVGIRLALQGTATVCAEAGDMATAIQRAALERPDICLIGFALPGGGIDAMREVAATVPGCLVVAIARGDDVDDLLEAVRAGAAGFVPVGFDAAQLRRVIEVVAAGEVAIPRSMLRELVGEMRALERVAGDRHTLRESQILAMLRKGESTARIAAGLEISPITVRRHISKLVQKAGVRDRAELVETAIVS